VSGQQANCLCCGRSLGDERSVAYGIGPECRQGMPPELLTRISEFSAKVRATIAAEQERKAS
jgi:hypothetical protein